MSIQPNQPDANELLLSGGKAPESVDFGQTPPFTVAGRVASRPKSYHAREYDARNPGQGKLRYYEDGNPVYGVSLDLDIPGVGVRRLYIEKLRMTTAVREAMRAAGVQSVDIGGWLSVTWTGTEAGQGAMPANTYAASYSAPGIGAVAAQQLAPAVQHVQQLPAGAERLAAPAYAPPAPAPAAVNPAPVYAPPPAAPAPTAPVIPLSVAEAMRNAGLSTDGYVVVAG